MLNKNSFKFKTTLVGNFRLEEDILNFLTVSKQKINRELVFTKSVQMQ